MKVQVSVNNVKIIEPSILNENEYNIHNCEFEFTEEYNGLTKKAVFTNEANETYVETIVDDKCSIPTEVLKEKEHIKIGVYAYDVDNEELLLRYSPRPTEFYVHEGSYKEAQNSTPPTPSEVEQLQSQITQNANDIEELQENYGKYDEDITELKSNVSNIQTEQTQQNTNIQNNTDNIVTLQNTKANQSDLDTTNQNLTNLTGRVSTNETDIAGIKEEQTTQNTNISANASSITNLENTKADKTEIPTKTSDLTNDSGFINKNVNDLVNYTLKTNTGSLIDLEINGTTYVITLSLKDVDGNVISTDTIDLPLESVVVGGSYDSANQKIVLTLENGNTVDIPVGDLIAGLQTEITSQNKLASDLVDDTNSGNKFVTTSEKQAWNAKLDESDLADYVKNTDYATNSKGGVIKVNDYYGAYAYDGTLLGSVKQYSVYENQPNSTFICKGTLENVITGKELVNKTYVDNIVGDIESILEELDIGGGVE